MRDEAFVHASRELDALVSFRDEGIHSNSPQFFWGRAKMSHNWSMKSKS